MTYGALKYFANDVLMRLLGAIQLLVLFPFIQERVGAEMFVVYVSVIALSMVIGRIGSLGLQDVLFRYLPRYGYKPLNNVFSSGSALIGMALIPAFATAYFFWGGLVGVFMVLVTLNLHLSGMYKQAGDFGRFLVLSVSFYSGPLIFFPSGFSLARWRAKISTGSRGGARA